MTHEPLDDHSADEDYTLPSRPAMTVVTKGNGRALNRRQHVATPRYENDEVQIDAPWLLDQYFDGEIDLDRELTARFPNMPLMSLFHARSLGKRKKRQVAALSAQDGSASILVEVDVASRALHFTFTLGSMLGLRFQFDLLSPLDRERWLDMLRSGDEALSFLWGQSRWEADYLICAAHRHYTNVFAFSASHTEAAARLTPDVTRRLLDWLQLCWTAPRVEESPAQLNGW